MNNTQLKLNQASARLQAADAAGCRQLCDQLIQQQPNLIAACHLRGVAAAQMGDRQHAISDLRRVWSRQKNNLHAALLLGSLLRQSEQYDESLGPLRAATVKPEFEIDARYELGRVLTRLRRPDDAMKEYRQILTRMPDHANAAANLGFLLERANRLDEAVRYTEQALLAEPANTMALLSRATLARRTGSVETAIADLKAMLSHTLSPLNKSIVFNQLGQCHDELGSWTEAFECFRQGNTILKEHHPFGVADDKGSYGLDTIKHIHDWLQTNPPVTWSPGPSADSTDPVFMVGFPRSGTTLLDQALSAHPDIEVLEEYEFLGNVRRSWTEGGGLQKVPCMTQADIRSARNNYLQELNKHRKLHDRSTVIDKLPLNLVYLFLIHRLFPDSRIILALRDPRDVCLSCFFQTFDLQGAMPYFLGLHDTTNYYDKVMSLAMDTSKLISNPMFNLKYENLVSQFEVSMSGLIKFLGLDWHDSVLDYRKNAHTRIISTPSYQQVVQPLYKKSIGRWKNYQAEMEPALLPVGQWLEYFAYSD